MKQRDPRAQEAIIQENAEILEETLRDFKVEAEVVDHLRGPVVMRTSGLHTQSVKSWYASPGSALPPDPSLIGRTYHVQGLCASNAGGGRLSNVLTQTIR